MGNPHILVSEKTRKRIDKIYYKLKIQDRNTTFDDVVRLLLDTYEEGKGEVVA